MRTRFTMTILACWTCLAVFSAAIVCAQTSSPAGEGEPWRKGKRFEKDLNALNLTPEQKTQVDKQRAAQREAIENIHQSIKTKRQELSAEMEKETTDKAKIDSIAIELKNLEGRRIDQEIKGDLQMKEVLTPDQFKKFNTMHKGRKHRRHGR